MDKIHMIIWSIVMIGVGVIIGTTIREVENQHKKYKMNLKCIQGELYEEIRPNMYAKSHLECFEQRKF